MNYFQALRGHLVRITPIKTRGRIDIFGLNAAREPDGFASVALKLSEYRKISPGPWEEFLFYDHPSGEVRIRTAMQWKLENMETLPKQTNQTTKMRLASKPKPLASMLILWVGKGDKRKKFLFGTEKSQKF